MTWRVRLPLPGLLHKRNCHTCNKETQKTSSDIGKNKSGMFFCSISCRQIALNKLPRKRMTLQGSCKVCQKPISKKRKRCQECIVGSRFLYLGDLKRGASQAQNTYTSIRNFAKAKASKSGVKKSCVICGYSKIVEVCHIKPISGFGEEDLIGDINRLENLTYLCPNHHAEFDRGFLKETPLSLREILISAGLVSQNAAFSQRKC